MANIQIPEPGISRFLFADTRAAWFWLVVRLYVAYVWLMAFYEKFSSPNWIGDNAGTAIKGFFMGALAKATGQYPQVSSWYAWFIAEVAMPNAVFFSYAITFGQFLVAAGLILGMFTGIAAFFGSFMNLNFLLAGTVSINPVLLLLQLFLMLAWRNAGWIGLDRFVLPKVGVPWQKEAYLIIINFMANIIQIPEPKISKFLFADTRASWFWLAVRLYVGYVWISAGYAKFINPAWIGDNAGKAASGFFTGAIAKATGQYPQVSGWYAYFLQNFAIPNAEIFSYIITYGEIFVGLGLIFGLFTGIAAFFGSVLNYNFLLAGTVGPNPVLLFLEIFLVLAWRNAGWIGLDRFALPKIGVPWRTAAQFK